ncbi:MAG: phosphate uptake regulator PhoU, partial [Desulfobacterales bacterium]|nr:phosphate uptake regulator PhoU [Desulfobacterales bacterium]
MDQRKIMSLGRSSLVITLPKHWTNLNELKQGDVVSLAIQRDRSLAIFPGIGSNKPAKEITLHIDPSEKAKTIKINIISCYLNGYSSIKIFSKDIFPVFQQKAIRNIVRILYMRIMECDAKSMHIVTLMDETKASVTSGIQRMHIISNSMFQDVLTSLETQDPLLAKATFQLEDDVDHFSYFMLRLLRRAALDPALANQLSIEISDCLDYQTLVHLIEQVANNASNIAKHIVLLRERHLTISDPLIKLMLNAGNNSHAIYNQAVQAFFSNVVDKAKEIIERGILVEKSDQEIATWAFLHEKKNPVIICAT